MTSWSVTEQEIWTTLKDNIKYALISSTNGPRRMDQNFQKKKTKCVHFWNQRKLHLDRKLSFIPHFKYLRTKCNKTIQLLRTIAHTNWGGSKEALLELYRSLIRSRLDYGCFIYGAARKTYLKELNIIHHQGFRLALGAYSTSIKSLYTEADEPSLKLRREKLALQYSTKMKSCPFNPAYDCTFNPKYKQHFERKEKNHKTLWPSDEVDPTRIKNTTK